MSKIWCIIIGQIHNTAARLSKYKRIALSLDILLEGWFDIRVELATKLDVGQVVSYLAGFLALP